MGEGPAVVGEERDVTRLGQGGVDMPSAAEVTTVMNSHVALTGFWGKGIVIMRKENSAQL